MSKSKHTQRTSITKLKAMKGKEKIVSLTAYSAPMAALIDQHVDFITMGDSLGMVCYGMESTLPVRLEMMIDHGKAVVNATQHACILIDMPFGSYQQSKEAAFENAAHILQETNAQCVKLEGGMEMVETVDYLCARGIPVMAHIGLKPQHVQQMGGYKYQGKTDDAAKLMLKEALAFQDAGAFALLIEGTSESVSATITKKVAIPTIGIGASPACDGQVLVTEDMLGLFESTPRFVKEYASIRKTINKAVKQYASDVRDGSFPAEEHCFEVKD
ncbi:MAG: 3-methyl-2-oxobutanoate hydroxymethyltransferase [Rickettsiales bacterium]|nr:3-methyl-2-oxobutanoate hydroxymethyltransferase [Rickettsiales bacterium]